MESKAWNKMNNLIKLVLGKIITVSCHDTQQNLEFMYLLCIYLRTHMYIYSFILNNSFTNGAEMNLQFR